MNQHDIAAHFLGRPVDDADRKVMDREGPPLQLDAHFDPRKKHCVLLTACHAIQIRHYLQQRADFMADFNVHVILTQSVCVHHMLHPMPPVLKAVLAQADVILSNRFVCGDYHEFYELNADKHPGKPTRKSIIYPPPNNSIMWPTCDRFARIELTRPMLAGKTRQQVWESLRDGTFDCCFPEREQLQHEWATEREADADIKLVPFVERNFRDCKLWWTENHCTFNLLAYVGSELLRLLGYKHDTDAQVCAYAPDPLGTWGVWPETHYEWDYYKLRYPMRWANVEGGLVFYRGLINASDVWPKDAAPCRL